MQQLNENYRICRVSNGKVFWDRCYGNPQYELNHLNGKLIGIIPERCDTSILQEYALEIAKKQKQWLILEAKREIKHNQKLLEELENDK